MPAIFLAFANNAENPLPTLKEENNKVNQILNKGKLKKQFIVHSLPFASREEIIHDLRQFSKDITIFLYSGHAGKDHLELEGSKAHAEGIAALLGRCPNLKLVILNGCSTKGQVTALMDQGIPAVIATNAKVEDYRSTQFSIAFFEELIQKKDTIKGAYDIAIDAAKVVGTVEGKIWKRGEMSLPELLESRPLWGLYYQDNKEEFINNWRLEDEFNTSKKSKKKKENIINQSGDKSIIILENSGSINIPPAKVIPQTNKKAEESMDNPPTGKWWKWVVGLGLLITIPAGIADFTGYNLKDIFSSGTDAFSVTVLVHGKNGKDDRILRNQGKVVLDIGDTREEEDINKEGEATFKGLSNSYQGKQALISINHPQPYFPTDRNASYLLEKGKSIYLEVALQGLNKINGRLLDFETENPLDSVRVSIKNIATYSDEFGWYELNIPPEKQTKFVKATFYKKGYKMEFIDSIAPHTQQEISLSLRKQ